MAERVKAKELMRKEDYNLLLKYLKEFGEKTGIVITEFNITFPYYGGEGLPVEITMSVKVML